MQLKPTLECFTVDDNCGRGTASLGNNILGHTGVVGGVRETSLFDDEVVVDGDVEVSEEE